MGDIGRDDERPAWARRIRSERTARGWSQAKAVDAMRAHAQSELPSTGSLLRNWKRWEAGDTDQPDDFYKALISKTFGTVTAAFFPSPTRDKHDSELLIGTGLDTLEIVARIQASDVSPVTLDALRITADRLCTEYAYMDSQTLAIEGRSWLRRITGLLDQRLTLNQHREVLALAGTVALLLGCVEYDMGLKSEAEATRRAAFSLGQESGKSDVMGWAYEMRAWFSLTQGNYRGVVTAAEAGEAMAPHQGVAVQLAAQRAKAWARLGDRRQVEVALDRGRLLLEGLPHPDNVENHFVVDPAKFDYYAMDCYRILGEDQRAKLYAEEVLRASIDFDGTIRAPMRVTEARVTLAVAEARAGDLSGAIELGRAALGSNRKSIPSLTMVGRELSMVLQDLYPDEAETRDYLDELRAATS